MSDGKSWMDEHEKGQCHVLTALFDDPSIDNSELRFAAYENRQIPKAIVDEAIEAAESYGDSDE